MAECPDHPDPTLQANDLRRPIALTHPDPRILARQQGSRLATHGETDVDLEAAVRAAVGAAQALAAAPEVGHGGEQVLAEQFAGARRLPALALAPGHPVLPGRVLADRQL